MADPTEDSMSEQAHQPGQEVEADDPGVPNDPPGPDVPQDAGPSLSPDVPAPPLAEQPEGTSEVDGADRHHRGGHELLETHADGLPVAVLRAVLRGGEGEGPVDETGSQPLLGEHALRVRERSRAAQVPRHLDAGVAGVHVLTARTRRPAEPPGQLLVGDAETVVSHDRRAPQAQVASEPPREREKSIRLTVPPDDGRSVPRPSLAPATSSSSAPSSSLESSGKCPR